MRCHGVKRVYIKENSKGGKSKITYTCRHTHIYSAHARTHIHNYNHYVIWELGKKYRDKEFYRMDLYMCDQELFEAMHQLRETEETAR